MPIFIGSEKCEIAQNVQKMNAFFAEFRKNGVRRVPLRGRRVRRTNGFDVFRAGRDLDGIYVGTRRFSTVRIGRAGGQFIQIRLATMLQR